MLAMVQEGEEHLVGSYGGRGSVEGRGRIIAAVLVLAASDVNKLLDALTLMRKDWRDRLVAAGLGHEGWRSRLDTLLGLAS